MDKNDYKAESYMSLRKFSDIDLPLQMNVPKKRIQIIESRLIRKTSFLYERRTITSPDEAADLSRKLFKNYDKEYVYALYLSSKSEPVAIELISIGTLNQSVLSPRDIIKTALLSSAAGYIIFHNHPSGGDITPSREDIQVTKRLNEASVLMGVRLYDHIIVSDVGYVSLKEREIF